MEIAIFILACLVMLTGLAGTVIPVLPGLPIIWAAILGFGWFSGWAYYGSGLVIVTGVIAVLSIVIDQLASAIGSKKFGAGKAGMIGSILGAIFGVIFFSLPGLLIGTFAGAMLFELVFNGRTLRESLSAGTGALLGFLAGSLFKFMLASCMIAMFLFYYIKG